MIRDMTMFAAVAAHTLIIDALQLINGTAFRLPHNKHRCSDIGTNTASSHGDGDISEQQFRLCAI